MDEVASERGEVGSKQSNKSSPTSWGVLGAKRLDAWSLACEERGLCARKSPASSLSDRKSACEEDRVVS